MTQIQNDAICASMRKFLLNKKNKETNKCRHQNKYTLVRYDTNDCLDDVTFSDPLHCILLTSMKIVGSSVWNFMLQITLGFFLSLSHNIKAFLY